MNSVNKSAITILLVGSLLLIGLFLLMRPAQETLTQPLELSARIVDFTVKDSQLAEGPTVVTVIKGTPVTLRFLSNENDEAHLHGYDLVSNLTPGQRSEISFVANISGRFDIELHKSHTSLAVLEVRPR